MPSLRAGQRQEVTGDIDRLAAAIHASWVLPLDEAYDPQSGTLSPQPGQARQEGVQPGATGGGSGGYPTPALAKVTRVGEGEEVSFVANLYVATPAVLDHYGIPAAEVNPLWMHRADCAFPCATQNEIGAKDAQHLLANGVYVVSEGANMPTVLDGVRQFIDARILYAPGKAANAGGVATSGLEMSQNNMRITWTREEVDDRLHKIMKAIHRACWDTAEEFGTRGNYVNGANIAGFLKVADSMMDQGLV